MNNLILSSLDKLEGLEKRFGIVGSITAIIVLLTVTAVVVLGIYGLLKFWFYSLEMLIPYIFEGWKL